MAAPGAGGCHPHRLRLDPGAGMSDDGDMANSLDFDDPDIELGLFKHGLIAHLIHHPPASGR